MNAVAGNPITRTFLSPVENCEPQRKGRALAGAASSVTLHCLAGCAIGEFIGLAVGVQLGLSAPVTIALATTLAFITGFAMTLLPLTWRGNMSLGLAFKTVWLGETISIGVMEIAMNTADYLAGGMDAASLGDPVFWLGFAAALAAGYVCAWPVNLYMLKRNMPRCHPPSLPGGGGGG